MREIKFRVYFEADEDEPSWMSEPITLLDLLHGEDIEFRNEEDTVSLPLNDFRFFYNKNAKYKILEYTGLHDKNGKEIYEGDILSNGYEKCLVVWIKGQAGFMLKLLDKEYENQEWTNPMIDLRKDDEVIGNVWEDSDLLNDSKNTKSN